MKKQVEKHIFETNKGSYLVDYQPSFLHRRARLQRPTLRLARELLTRLAGLFYANTFPLKTDDKLVWKNFNRTLEGLDPVGVGPTPGSVSFEELANLYYDKHAMVHMRNPQKAEYWRVQRLIKLLPGKLAGVVTYSELDDMITEQMNEGRWNAATANRNMTTLDGIFKFGLSRSLVKENPAAQLVNRKGAKPRERHLSPEEVQALLGASKPRLQRAIRLGLTFGFRPANIREAKKEHIANNKLAWTNYKAKPEPKKHYFPLKAPQWALLNEILSDCPDGFLADSTNLDRDFEQAVKDAGLWKPADDPQKVTLNTLRHTFISDALMAGASLKYVANCVGHADTRMIDKVYGHLVPERMEDEGNLVGLVAGMKVTKD
jgi:integrase